MLLEDRFIDAKNWIISNFGEINSNDICYSGINSVVWRIDLKEYSFALKLFKIKNNDEIYKYEKERQNLLASLIKPISIVFQN